MTPDDKSEYSQKEAQARFEAALKGGFEHASEGTEGKAEGEEGGGKECKT